MRFSSLIRTSGVVAACAAAAALSLLPGRAAHAEILYGITGTNLVSFDSTAPTLALTNVAYSGVVTGQTLRAIDFRSSNGQLYALSTNGTTAAQLYTVNLATAALTAVGSGLTLTGTTSTTVSIDFNPVADALRVVTGNLQNYRVNANTGALIAQDSTITGSGSSITDIAYTNAAGGATTLYAYDYFNDTIGTIGGLNGASNGGPNLGVYASVGSTGVSSLGATTISFDISSLTGTAFVGLSTGSSLNPTTLYTANLSTGALTSLGTTGVLYSDIAARGNIVPAAAPEPGSLTLLGMGLAGGAGTLGIVRRKRKAA